MKFFTPFLLLLCLTFCAYAQTTKSEEVQQLINKTYQQMIFVKGGSFMMGDPVQPFVDIVNYDSYLPKKN